MIDNYEPRSRGVLTGLQGSFTSIGGIILSLGTGFLLQYFWYAGFMMLMLCIVGAIMAVANLPKADKTAEVAIGKIRDLPKDVFYFVILGAFGFVLMYAVAPNNMSTHLHTHGIENFSELTGMVISVQLIGAVCSGYVFKFASPKFGDNLIAIGFTILAAGFVVVGLGVSSIPVIFISSFFIGFSMCFATPQGIMSMSRYVDESNSFWATMLYNCIFMGLGGYLSAPFNTGITQALFGDDTVKRYVFTGGMCLVVAIIILSINTYRKKIGKVTV
jgi:hypothetical protein